MIPVEELLEIQNQAQVLHWQTTSYAKHQALGGFYDGFGDLVDGFLEVYMGNVGRPTVSGGTMLKNISEMSPEMFILEVIDFLKLQKEEVPSDFTDLQNILDEMIALANKTKYLFTLS